MKHLLWLTKQSWLLHHLHEECIAGDVDCVALMKFAIKREYMSLVKVPSICILIYIYIISYSYIYVTNNDTYIHKKALCFIMMLFNTYYIHILFLETAFTYIMSFFCTAFLFYWTNISAFYTLPYDFTLKMQRKLGIQYRQYIHNNCLHFCKSKSCMN